MRSVEELRRGVLVELWREPGMDAAGIGVAVRDGVVTLTGTVVSPAQKRAAERAARRVPGVRAVENHLAVPPAAGADEDGDAALAEAARRALERAAMVPPGRVEVKVDDGWVELEGEVDGEYQREAAVEAAAHVVGVRGIVNRITLAPAVGLDEVETRIAAALHRFATAEARRISVDAVGPRVVLHGRVRTWAERDEVERAAAAAPGVTDVESHLEVDAELPFTA